MTGVRTVDILYDRKDILLNILLNARVDAHHFGKVFRIIASLLELLQSREEQFQLIHNSQVLHIKIRIGGLQKKATRREKKCTSVSGFSRPFH